MNTELQNQLECVKNEHRNQSCRSEKEDIENKTEDNEIRNCENENGENKNKDNENKDGENENEGSENENEDGEKQNEDGENEHQEDFVNSEKTRNLVFEERICLLLEQKKTDKEINNVQNIFRI